MNLQMPVAQQCVLIGNSATHGYDENLGENQGSHNQADQQDVEQYSFFCCPTASIAQFPEHHEAQKGMFQASTSSFLSCKW
jgi:hypothetical protein